MSSFWTELFNRWKRCQVLADEAGQSVIEYVLVMIVVVGVILGVLYQFNQAFRFWADNYFGDYLSCLLETGELPALGGQAGTCNEQYKSFSLADGRPLVRGGSGGGPGSVGSEGRSGSGPGAGGDSALSGTYSGGGGGGNYVASRDGEGFGSSGNRFRAGGRRGGGDDSGGGSGGRTGTAEVTNLSGYQEGQVVRIPVRSRGVTGGVYLDEREGNDTTFAAGTLDRGDTPAQKAKLVRIERKPTDDGPGEEDEGLSFGRLLRLLIMAAIIIAVVVFLGGQILQASKNME